jgi:chemotaxis protein MotB
MMISNMRRRLVLPLLGMGLGVVSLLGGCVGQGEYDRLYEVNSSLTAQNKDLARQLDECKQASDLMSRSSMSGDKTLVGLQRQNQELRSQLDRALADFKNLQKELAGMEFGSLNPETDRALRELAAAYPDMITYDAARGMLRFAADLTFDSGKDVVKPNAKDALSALGKVLTSSAASEYTVVVEGHTDSQRIGASKAQHPTNRHLSAHRAISVTDELGKMGVPSDRMMAAGWGEFHPLVANNANGNTVQNRRVEIFLAKSHSTTTAEANTPTTKPATSTTANDEIDITK